MCVVQSVSPVKVRASSLLPRNAVRWGATLVVLGQLGCATAWVAPSSTPIRETSTSLTMEGEPLTLHLANPKAPSGEQRPLVLYASGDGGWFGAAVGMFRTIAHAGFPVVGFSTKTFLHIERGRAHPISVGHIAKDYQGIVERAKAELHLPADTPVLLTGWSRGAALAVLVGVDHRVGADVTGIVAIGLTIDEQLDVDGGDDGDPDVDDGGGVRTRPAGRVIDLYPLLSQLPPRRTVVIQASKDAHLPAARARELFGPDTDVAHFMTVEAHNHRFSGGEAQFAETLRQALTWLSSSAQPSIIEDR